MRRDLRRLADETFDLLIIGAGVYGAAMAWDAAQRGLSVALVDRGDIGAGTSFNNAKTVHGGVRSLQHGQFREMREYLRERRTLARIAPHLVHPLPFLLPTSRALTRHRLALRAYFTLYDALTADRNDGVDPARHLPPSEAISRDECLRRHPLLDPDGITGAIVWHDCQMYSGDRVTLAYAQSAARAGAAVANYLEAVTLLREGAGAVTSAGATAGGAGDAGARARADAGVGADTGVDATGSRNMTRTTPTTRTARVIGATLRDRLTGASFDVRAAVTVNATGPWSGELLASLGAERPIAPVVPALSLAMNLVTRRVTTDCAVGGTAQGRLFFLAPWRDVTIAGTSHDPFTGTASALRATTADVTRLLTDVNTAFPGAGLRLDDDVRLVHRGLLPAASVTGSHVALLKHSRVRDHREDGWSGLMSLVGVRYTTARHTAEQATDMAFALLGRAAPPCRTSTTPLAGGEIESYASFLAEATGAADVVRPGPDATAVPSTGPTPGATAGRGTAPGRTTPDAGALDVTARERLARLYGTAYPRVLDIARENPALAAPLGPGCPTLGAEIAFAVREEMALHLSDALLRRTDAGSAGHPGAEAVSTAARIMGDALGWSAGRADEEVTDLERVYRIDD